MLQTHNQLRVKITLRQGEESAPITIEHGIECRPAAELLRVLHARFGLLEACVQCGALGQALESSMQRAGRVEALLATVQQEGGRCHGVTMASQRSGSHWLCHRHFVEWTWDVCILRCCEHATL